MIEWLRGSDVGDEIARQLQEDERNLRELSDAYLRLRSLIPGAFNTPHGPTSEQVWHQTEKSLRRMKQSIAAAREVLRGADP